MDTHGKAITLSREELYERVWSIPMQRLAAEFGLSDVGLAKVCKKHKIPRPARGYWAKLEHGKKVDRYPLLPVEDKSLLTVKLRHPDEVAKQAAETPTVAIDPAIAALIEAEPTKHIVPVTSLRGAHPLVLATRDALSDRKADEFGRLSPARDLTQPIFDVRVSRISLRRALLLVETLVRAFQQRGFTIVECGEKMKRPEIELRGRTFTISVWGPSNRRKRDRSSERNGGDRSSVWWRYSDYEHVPTGNLELTLYPVITLRDTKTKLLESRLSELMVRTLKYIDEAQVKAERARLEAERKRSRKLAAIEQEISRREDSVRIASLNTAIPAWVEALRVRAFIEAVRVEAAHRHGTVDEASEVGRWLRWAEAYLASIDPLDASRPLPNYTLSETEIEGLREECEADWSDWTESFSSHRP